MYAWIFFTLLPQLTTNIIYKNVACAGSQGLKTVELRYTSEITLNVTTYNDPQGYYVVWERCCRTAGVDNLVNRGQNVGMTFMLEFPALTQNGRFFKNSSPEFTTPNGDYICINKPFKMSMKATDGDGDELRYSLVTPLQGYTTNTQTDDKIGLSHSSYPEVKWATGYGLSNVIPGKPALAVDPQKGELSVIANELGLFVFTVLVEEYRNGVRIGSVRRDFQLKVVDCGGSPPPVPTVFESSNTTLPAKTVEICEGSSIDLTFTTTADVLYQWSLDGTNIPNENKNTLKVKTPGEYQVSASFAKKCTNDTISQIVKVVLGKGPNVRLNPSDTIKICDGDTALLQATQGGSYRYEWLRNGTLIANEAKNILSTKQTGNYIVSATSSNSTCPT
ncbi:MAG: gliding motility-associated C-terminal domain-containing protein, partial [Spirosomataceae bacterium]